MESNIGLSEYTNANFVTQDTAFAPGFNYPDLGSIVEYPEIKDGYARTYLRKLGKVDGQGGNGEHIEHLAVAGWLYKRLPTDQKKLALRPVFDDYAPKLIPRAVGYAAQLMSYFFRGQIDVADSQLTGTSATFKVINNTPNESMGPGALVIAYEYNGNYGVSSEVQMGEIIAPGSESANDYTVTFSQSIPSDADIKYRLVFKGKLGNEDNAVVAKLAWSSANGTFGCVGSSGGGTPFYVPPLQSEGGSFTVSGQACCADWGIYDYTIDCSYTSGYMDCYFRPYFIDPNWNGGMPVLCAIDRCEGSWDGYNFYSVCTLEQQGSGICYQKAECTPIYMKIETGMEPSGSAANGNAASIAPSSSTTNANCGSMLKLK